MGKLRTPTSPTGRSVPTFPRMEPPPPYEAPSSRSSSAHSHDRLNVEGSAPSQQPNQQPIASQPRQQASLEMSESETKSCGDEGGCLTFGVGASGCMVYGKNAQGCMNYGDNADGWYVPWLEYTAFVAGSNPQGMVNKLML